MILKPLLLNRTYTPTQLKQNSSEVFNSVQENGIVVIKSSTRPLMIMMKMDKLNKEREIFESNIKILTDKIKKLEEK